MNEADTALKESDLDAVEELLADVPDEELRGLVLALVQQRRDDLDRTRRSARDHWLEMEARDRPSQN
jgi:hypothetical protein